MRARRKYYTPDPYNSDAKAICDRSGFVFKHSDLVQQMEWRGDALVWTGLMVGKPFLDKPNEQLRNPVLLPDPVPVPMPRPYKIYDVVWSNQMIPWGQLTIQNWASWNGSENGVLAVPVQDREQYLEEGIVPPQNYPGPNVADNYNVESQIDIFNSLSKYNWSTPSV